MFESRKFNWLKSYMELGLIVLVCLFFHRHLIDSGYFMDDVFRSYVRGTLLRLNQGVFENFLLEWIDYAKSIGRFFPFSFHNIFYFFDKVSSYKIFILFMFGVNLVLFYYFVNTWIRSHKLSLLLLLLVTISIQIRNYHDPMLSYYGLVQLVFSLLLISLLFWSRYLNSPRKIYFFLSLTFYFLMTLTYDISYVFFIFHLFLSFLKIKEDDKNISSNIQFLVASIKKTGPFVTISLLMIVFSLGLKLIFNIGFSGVSAYSPNLDFGKIFTTILVQSAGSIPLTYHFHKQNFNFDQIKLVITSNPAYFISTLFEVIVFIFAINKLLKSSIKNNFLQQISNKQIYFIRGFGAILLFAPSLLISVSKRYQGEVVLGQPYLPVFISYFGFCLLVLSAIIFMKRKIQFISFYFILSLIMIIHRMDSYNVIYNEINPQWKYPREVITNAAKIGLFSELNSKTVLWLTQKYPWEWEFDSKKYFTPESFYKSIGVDVSSVSSPVEEKSGGYLLKYTANNACYGSAILSDLSGIKPLRVYVFNSCHKVDPIIKGEYSIPKKLFNVPISQYFDKVKEDRLGELYQLKSNQSNLDPLSLIVFFDIN